MNELYMLPDFTENNPQLAPLFDIVNSVIELSDEALTPTTVEVFQNMLQTALTPALHKQSVEQIITNYKNNNAPRGSVKNELTIAKTTMQDFVNGLDISTAKRTLLNGIFENFYKIFDDVMQQYNSYDIELPITLAEGAHQPAYAHDTDAAADLYALEDTRILAGSRGNMIHTGVHIGLPEGWVAYIVPRSSTGTKTPLRLSNSVGVIDAGYRGELCVLYDNISDMDYTITAGDRIAQLIVMPSYHFKANIVETLDETERGEGGFGSSGD